MIPRIYKILFALVCISSFNQAQAFEEHSTEVAKNISKHPKVHVPLLSSPSVSQHKQRKLDKQRGVQAQQFNEQISQLNQRVLRGDKQAILDLADLLENSTNPKLRFQAEKLKEKAIAMGVARVNVRHVPVKSEL